MPSICPWGCYVSHKRYFYVLIVTDLLFKSINVFMLFFTLLALFAFLFSPSLKNPAVKIYGALRFCISVLMVILLTCFITAFIYIYKDDYGVNPELAVAISLVLYCFLSWDIYMSWKFLEYMDRVLDHDPLPQFEKRSMFSELV